MKKKVLWLFALVLLVVGIIDMTPILFPASPEPGSGKNADSFCLGLLAKKSHKDALQWLNEATPRNKRLIGEQNSSDSRRIVERLYEMGAVNVQAVDIQKEAGFGEGTNILIVSLPENSEKRRKLFSYEAKISSANGFDPTSDDGQKYMFLFKFKLRPFSLAVFRMLGFGNN